ncbi:hypothetical protein D7X87_24325 [bacterium D16-54]|nr:hypothetical protein D7X87_24325 [bacterium D16-54]RKJ09777.1 hypothetical protein D7X65_24700 [bacterium D16-56]
MYLDIQGFTDIFSFYGMGIQSVWFDANRAYDIHFFDIGSFAEAFADLEKEQKRGIEWKK